MSNQLNTIIDKELKMQKQEVNDSFFIEAGDHK
jgi:hypothetical protein